MNRKRILVVEDDVLLRRMYKVLLPKHIDCSVHVVEDGNKALAIFKKESYDLIITDLSMPVLNGRELYIQIQDLCVQQSREMPLFLFCSGVKNALDNVTEFCVESLNRQILKPFPLAKIQNAVQDMLATTNR